MESRVDLTSVTVVKVDVEIVLVFNLLLTAVGVDSAATYFDEELMLAVNSVIPTVVKSECGDSAVVPAGAVKVAVLPNALVPNVARVSESVASREITSSVVSDVLGRVASGDVNSSVIVVVGLKLSSTETFVDDSDVVAVVVCKALVVGSIVVDASVIVGSIGDCFCASVDIAAEIEKSSSGDVKLEVVLLATVVARAVDKVVLLPVVGVEVGSDRRMVVVLTVIGFDGDVAEVAVDAALVVVGSSLVVVVLDLSVQVGDPFIDDTVAAAVIVDPLLDNDVFVKDELLVVVADSVLLVCAVTEVGSTGFVTLVVLDGTDVVEVNVDVDEGNKVAAVVAVVDICVVAVELVSDGSLEVAVECKQVTFSATLSSH